MDVLTFGAKRRTQLVVIAFGLAMLAVGAGIAPRIGGWVAIALGAVAVLGGLTAFVPGAAYVRLSPDGLTVKYAFLPARTVAWPDIAAVTSELVPLIRHRLPSLVVTYAPGYTGAWLGQRLDDTRSYVGNFTIASGDELAAKAGEYLARYRG
jgi:hypothetical protein